jgi:hypothetical protein
VCLAQRPSLARLHKVQIQTDSNRRESLEKGTGYTTWVVLCVYVRLCEYSICLISTVYLLTLTDMIRSPMPLRDHVATVCLSPRHLFNKQLILFCKFTSYLISTCWPKMVRRIASWQAMVSYSSGWPKISRPSNFIRLGGTGMVFLPKLDQVSGRSLVFYFLYKRQVETKSITCQ